MATKVLARTTYRRRTAATQASGRPRKRPRIDKDDGPPPQDAPISDEMTSDLEKQAHVNNMLQSGQRFTTPQPNPAITPAPINGTPSTNKLSAQEQCSSGAHPKFDSPKVKLELEKEFLDNYMICMNMDEFFDKYVPTRGANPPVDARISGAFDEVIKATGERGMYKPFLEGLKCLNKRFPPHIKIASYDTSNVKFPELHPDHAKTMPDVTSTFPGVRKKPAKWTWQHAALVWELKLDESLDPIDERGNCKASDDHEDVRVQLLKVARNLLMAHLSCFVFVVGVYGGLMRFFRFDHSGIIGSPAFDYVESPELLRRFLWQFAHPVPYSERNPGSGAIVGADPTILKPSSSAFKQYFSRLTKKCPHLVSQKEEIRLIARLIEARIDLEVESQQEVGPAVTENVLGGDGDAGGYDPINSSPAKDMEVNDEAPGPQKVVQCFAFQILHFSTGVIGRATHVFKVFILGDYPEGDQICTLKDSWQQQTRWDEGYFYRRIKRLSHHPVIREELKQSILKLDLSEHGAYDKTGLANNIGTWNLKICSGAEVLGLVTQSGRLRLCNASINPTLFDRSRVRSLMKNIGRPLSTFRSTKEFITALRDAIRAIEFLRKCGVLHRDISSGNILLNESPDTIGGFLHDLDYSTPVLSSVDRELPTFREQIEKDLKDMTGTRPFMAIGILSEDFERHQHAVHHDLESVYWVAMWFILRHTDHNSPHGKLACSKLFKDGEDDVIQQAKQVWLMRNQHPAVNGNAPLTALIDTLRTTFRSHSLTETESFVDIATVLRVFDNALMDERWPTDDASIKYETPKTDEKIVRESLKRANKNKEAVITPVINQVQQESGLNTGSKRKREVAATHSNKSVKGSLNRHPRGTHDGIGE